MLVNEKEVAFDVIGGDADYSVGISMADVRGESKDNIPVKIVVDAGLTCPGSTYQTKEKMEFTGRGADEGETDDHADDICLC